jgi:hypothetical protein
MPPGARTLAVFLISLVPTLSLGAETTTEVQIVRQECSQTCSTGYILLNGTAKWYSLELGTEDKRGLYNVEPGIYTGTMRFDSAKGNANRELARLELSAAGGRSAIQIHIGNTPKDSEGCILIGKDRPDTCFISDSKNAAWEFVTSLAAAMKNTQMTVKVTVVSNCDKKRRTE